MMDDRINEIARELHIKQSHINQSYMEKMIRQGYRIADFENIPFSEATTPYFVECESGKYVVTIGLSMRLRDGAVAEELS